jgi:RNA recognition motif-containing protein
MAASENRTAFVSNINYRTVGKTLGDALVKFGPIESVHIATEFDGRGKRSRGFGFVEFKTRAGLDAAIASHDELIVDDRHLRIGISRPRPRVTVSVLGIPADTTNEDVLEAFKDYHPTEVRIVAKADERGRGVAFVTFAAKDDQARAVGDHRDKGIALKGGTSIVRFARTLSGARQGDGPPAAERRAPRAAGPRSARGGARQTDGPPAAEGPE